MVSASLREFLFAKLSAISRVLWASALIVWIALLTFLAVSRGPQIPEIPMGSFFWNFAHAPVYGLLGPLTLFCFPRCEGRTDASFRNLFFSLAVVLAVGFAHEWLQGTTSYRNFSLWDWASDGAGGVSLLGLFALLRRKSVASEKLFLYAALSLLLCAFPAWADTQNLSF